jgi:hypothetical protein
MLAIKTSYSDQQMMTSVTSAFQASVALQWHVSQLQDLRRQRAMYGVIQRRKSALGNSLFVKRGKLQLKKYNKLYHLSILTS